ncbi:dual OB domain-containing protein [Enterobacter sichuanensis]|uniref:dual OB domain-containing protein n=1 Tax=Enterobacter sichuanensis TaxID=2071710 RepID=UPI002A80423F|nr:hypothetical protein [Enterobacter sichuanensis]
MGKLTFVCLSKSKKPGGYCVAGKTLKQDGSIGEWIRPLNKFGSINDQDCVYQGGTYAKPLDIIEAEFIKGIPENFQTENHLIDSTKYWIKKGEYPSHHKELMRLCDSPGTLWSNKYQSKTGKCDQVHPDEATKFTESLYFIYVDEIQFHTSRWEGEPIKVRGEFIYNDIKYNLRVTDIVWIDHFEKMATGVYNEIGKFVTVSLAHDLHKSVSGDFHYKLIAEVM